MTPVSPRRAALALLVLLAGCDAPAGNTADGVRGLSPEASLDARGLGRGVAAGRPAAVQVQDTPGNPLILYLVSPRLQTGSPTSPPLIVTSFGAERQRADGSVAYRALVTVGTPRGLAGFSRAATRQGETIPVQVLGRENRCGAGSCLYEERLMLTFPPDMVRQAAEAGQPLRARVSGSAAFIEVNVPPGHVRALVEATAQR